MSPTIVVVGSINTDLVFRTPRMPALGETMIGHEFVQVAGGKGANQAVAAARQGAVTRFIGCVGDDAYGRQALANLQAEHINTDDVHTLNAVATGVAGIFVDDHGNNSIVVAPGANAQLTPLHIEAAKDVIARADVLICQCEVPLPTVVAAIDIAAQHGVTVVFNPAPACSLPDALLAKVDYLIVNETESAQLSGVEVIDIASAHRASLKLLARGAGCVLLTLGEHGVCMTEKNQTQHHLPAFKVEVVDTTGAGDTFVGVFSASLARGLSVLDAVSEAQCAAALAVTKLGAQSSIPYRKDVEHFVNTARHHGA